MSGQQYSQPPYPQVRLHEASQLGGMPVTPVQPPMVPIQSHFHQAPLQPDSFPDPYRRAIPSDPQFHQAPGYYGQQVSPEPAYYGHEAFPTEPTHVAGPFGAAPPRQGQYPCSTPDPQPDDDDETLDDLPLLEELGIRPAEIAARIQGVLFFRDVDLVVIQDVDIIGPMLMVVALGLCLLCSGKVQFGYIYGLGIVGSIGIWALLNMLSQTNYIGPVASVSILGYSLMPVTFLAAVSVFVSLRSVLGVCLALSCVLWSTTTASRFFEAFLELRKQRYLAAYPIFLLYASFTLLAVF